VSWARTSRHERGYGARWTRLRVVVLKRDGYLCRCPGCIRSHRLRPATEVHHVIAKADGGDDSTNNLIAINEQCHRKLTAEQQGHKPKARYNAFGYRITK
jgi:5-methylcytosine-specific restriction protein A